MRVVVVHNRYRSLTPSGENEVVDADIEELRSDGVEVVPYLRSSDEIADFGLIARAGLAARPVVSPGDSRALGRLLRTGVDLVHLHNPFPLISPWVIRTANGHGVPVVQTVHNYRHACVSGVYYRDSRPCADCRDRRIPWPAVVHGCYQSSRLASVPMAVAITAHRGTWRAVERYFAVGDAVVDHLRSLGIPEERIEVRRNTVRDPGDPTPPGAGALFAGRLSVEKGVGVLLEAWQRSGVGRTGQTLSIAGDGELAPAVVTAAAHDPSIRALGLLDRAALDRAYRDAALVVVPSLWPEPDPIALVTALAHGRGVLATRLGSMPSTLGTDAGWTVEPTIEGVAAGVTAALGDPGELERRGRAARQVFERTRRSSVDPLRHRYQHVLAGTRSSAR